MLRDVILQSSEIDRSAVCIKIPEGFLSRYNKTYFTVNRKKYCTAYNYRTHHSIQQSAVYCVSLV